jgi:hypothetical protein
MTYRPPSGWVELLPSPDPEMADRHRFHVREDCPRVRDKSKLRHVDRPWSAVRCGGCAEFYGNNREEIRATG